MTTTTPRPTKAYRDLNVLRWMVGLFLSLLGDQVFFITLAWTATQVAPPSIAGIIVAAGAVPRAVFMLFGGAIADRAGPRKTALLSDAARTLVMLAVAGLLLLEQPSITILIALAAIFGLIDAVFIPAIGAMPAALVEPVEMTRVTAMRQVIHRATAVAGAPLAGYLVAAQALPVIYAICAALFAASVLALIATHTHTPITAETSPTGDADDQSSPTDEHPEPVRSLLRDVTEGLQYVRGHNLLLPLLVLSAVVELGFSGAINVGLPLLAKASGWGPQGIGWVLGAWGGAAALTSLALTAFGSPTRAGLVGLCSLPVMGLALTAIGLVPGLPAATATAAVLGVGSGIVAPLFGGLTLAAADPAQVGRVMAVLSLATLGGAPLAYAATGVLVGLLDARAPFLLGGAFVTITGLAGFTSRPLRSARANEQPT